jgi:hypothetical protein
MKTVAIMQPYFLPHTPYFQLAAAADQFVLCDNFQYTRKGWINRNHFLQNGGPARFTLPLEDSPRETPIDRKRIAPSFNADALLRRFEAAYQSAPSFKTAFPLLASILLYPEPNLFLFLEHSIHSILQFLGIAPEMGRTSSLESSTSLSAQKRVIAMCRELQADRYVNSIGGIDLYSPEAFQTFGVDLKFLAPLPKTYPQGTSNFVPNLSIVDRLMHQTVPELQQYLRNGYELR